MRVHELDRLELKALPGKRLVVLGDPVRHSLSPAMHNAALARMQEEWPHLAGWVYEAVHVADGQLPRALERLHAEGVRGINLTLPHKVPALPLVQRVDETARRMGAVNTLIREADGYGGTNTDGFGIRMAVEEAFKFSLEGRDVWLFGAGGAARGIMVACLEGGCRRLTVLNRSADRLRELAEQFEQHPSTSSAELRFSPFQEAPEDPAREALLINATSLGLKPGDPNPIAALYLRPGVAVYDTTYGARSRLALDCQRIGIPYADGLGMLVWQGARSLEIWTGHPVPAEVMRAAAEAALRERLAHE